MAIACGAPQFSFADRLTGKLGGVIGAVSGDKGQPDWITGSGKVTRFRAIPRDIDLANASSRGQTTEDC